tara:strand:- start:732 stop:1118 length:387 start_codon:yes stop_codon:yes gene_type:complete
MKVNEKIKRKRFGMFTQRGNNAVRKLIIASIERDDLNKPNWLMRELRALAERNKTMREATDTDVVEQALGYQKELIDRSVLPQRVTFEFREGDRVIIRQDSLEAFLKCWYSNTSEGYRNKEKAQRRAT